MSDYLVTDAELTSVANAIRTKGGTSANLSFPTGFVSAINAISGGAEYEEGQFTPSEDMLCYENPIMFADTHSEGASFVFCGDLGGDTSISDTNTFWGITLANVYKLLGHGFYASASAVGNGIRGYGVLRSGTGNTQLQYSHGTGDNWSTATYEVDYMLSKLGFYAVPRNYNKTCFRANRTYKWIAIWT